MTVGKYENFKVLRRFDWYGHQILVWPIAALPNDFSANQNRVFGVGSDVEAGFTI
jgi:hypothetical protein